MVKGKYRALHNTSGRSGSINGVGDFFGESILKLVAEVV